MNRKIEEMIALGVAYAVNCQPCMEYHKQRAVEAGLTKEEMHAAIQAAESVKMGAYRKTKRVAGSLFGDVKEEKCCPVGT